MPEDHSTNGDVHDTVSIERQILRFLCSCDGGTDIDHFSRELLHYSWREPEHATVFQAIRSLAARGRGSWREELPAETTRMGFPDVEWRRYFEEADSNGSSLPDLVRRLLSSVERPPKT
jgi:hypothetical protein